MPLIGKNADYFFAFHRTGGPYQASRQGRAASSSMELFKGGWGQCYPTSKCRCVNTSALLAQITKAPKVQEIAVLFSGSYLSYNGRETGLTVPCVAHRLPQVRQPHL